MRSRADLQEQEETLHKHPEEDWQLEVSQEDVERAVDAGEGGLHLLPGVHAGGRQEEHKQLL